MSSHAEPREERMLQLLADHATDVLDSNSAAELVGLLSVHPEYDEFYFEPSVAAIDLAMTPPSSEPLPKRLRDRILIDAKRFLETAED